MNHGGTLMMNNRKKALLCLSVLTSTILGSAFLGGASAWADRDDWGHRGYFSRPYYHQASYWGGYRPHYGYANPWGGRGWGGRGWDRGGWGGYRGCGWNRGGWGGRGWDRGGWGGYRGRRGWW